MRMKSRNLEASVSYIKKALSTTSSGFGDPQQILTMIFPPAALPSDHSPEAFSRPTFHFVHTFEHIYILPLYVGQHLLHFPPAYPFWTIHPWHYFSHMNYPTLSPYIWHLVYLTSPEIHFNAVSREDTGTHLNVGQWRQRDLNKAHFL